MWCGIVICGKDDIVFRETTESIDAYAHEAWDVDWIRRSFAAFLRCNNTSCGEVLVAAGRAYVDEQNAYGQNGDIETDYVDNSLISAVVPPPPLILVDENVLQQVSEHLDAVFALFWIDPSAAIGRLRICI